MCYQPLNVKCAFVCVLVFVRVISNQSTSKNPIMCQKSVVLTPCCTKYTARSFLYLDTKASNVYIHNIIKLCNTSNVVQSPIKLKKQDNRKSSVNAVWRRQGRGVNKISKKEVRSIAGGLHKIGVLCQLWR